MIALQALTFAYAESAPVFESFSWQVGRGEAWAVLGPSGCGKTTLLYLLAGLHQPSAGRCLVAGQPLLRPRPRTGLILQDYGLLPWATVHQNVALGLRVRQFYGPDARHAPADEPIEDPVPRIDSWLTRLGLADVQDHYPAQLSGGQRQRTAIARTLALNPDLLLMDEPFASLDAPTREALQDLVLLLRVERDLTTVAVTHAIEEAALVGGKVLVLGRPPNRAPQIVDNPGGGQSAFRGTPAFQATCDRLRQALERGA